MAFLPAHKFLPKEFLNQNSASPQIICGLDEVGRGPWAGPLVAAALIFIKDTPIKGCKDSKKLTADEREHIFAKLQKISVYGVGVVSVEEVDKLGLIKANNMAFLRALEELTTKLQQQNFGQTFSTARPDFLLVDGRDKLQLPYPFKTVIKGDEKIKLIACASIIAKVTRDRMMQDLALQYPEYGFAEHKGYGTKRHQQALALHGVCQIHRKSYRPVKEYMKGLS